MENLTLRGRQLSIQRRLAKEDIPFDVWRLWKQQPVRGMFWRGLFKLTAKLAMTKNDLGMKALAQYSLQPEKRKNPFAPVFNRRDRPVRKPVQKASHAKIHRKKLHLVA